ncbi:hypothetical protein A2U01_0054714, partial [Trifolium medium]|nr:hypothetical protein [Trifolium medium]
MRKSDSPKRKRSPRRELSPKRRVEANEGKKADDSEEEKDPGKRPFVAAIMGGPNKSLTNPTT